MTPKLREENDTYMYIYIMNELLFPRVEYVDLLSEIVQCMTNCVIDKPSLEFNYLLTLGHAFIIHNGVIRFLSFNRAAWT